MQRRTHTAARPERRLGALAGLLPRRPLLPVVVLPRSHELSKRLVSPSVSRSFSPSLLWCRYLFFFFLLLSYWIYTNSAFLMTAFTGFMLLVPSSPRPLAPFSLVASPGRQRPFPLFVPPFPRCPLFDLVRLVMSPMTGSSHTFFSIPSRIPDSCRLDRTWTRLHWTASRWIGLGGLGGAGQDGALPPPSDRPRSASTV